ncbi:hypothetical protein [Pseudoroseomonas cervicalis]|uniref:hypothetical protein n=1 Tax=Teichococcus cervicalis TaxID=204525 RepID=UPI00278B098F|nr:hypothetical protein [Pseudoroseomonas cervicalis]MDQ1081187.1 hypothetical protein [Pseudoroseomonas cervicalis]
MLQTPFPARLALGHAADLIEYLNELPVAEAAPLLATLPLERQASSCSTGPSCNRPLPCC